MGLAFAILIDATIIRGVLLPATMKLLGDWNWYLPSFLEWIPQPHGEHDEDSRQSRTRGRLRTRRRPGSEETDQTMPQPAPATSGRRRAADRTPT